MKPAFLALIFCLSNSFCGTLEAEQKYPDPWLPRPHQVGDWNTISERFMKWEITEFEYKGGIADGGSKGFWFKTSDGAEFYVLVVASSWWTKEDWKKKQQPIYLSFDNKDYRVSKGGETQTRLLAMLKRAAKNLKGDGDSHPRYIERLGEIVKSRAYRYQDWPYDRLDLEGESGNWKTISERFKKWDIVEFNQWYRLTDYSIIFRFKTSDGSKIGVLLTSSSSDLNPKDRKVELTGAYDPFDAPPFPRTIFLLFEKQLYRIEKGGETETRLLTMLKRAATNLESDGDKNPKYIERLREIVKSRTNNYANFPMTKAEVEGK